MPLLIVLGTSEQSIRSDARFYKYEACSSPNLRSTG